MNQNFDQFASLVASRRSCRGYLPTSVERDVIEQIARAAQHSASWCNTQPWQVHIVSGQRRDELAEALTHSAIATFGQPDLSDFAFPREYTGVYAERRRAVGWQLYDAMGVERGDKTASAVQALRNFEFFGAPHVAIVTTPEALGTYGAVDCGVYVNSFLLAAQAAGVATCAQAALAQVSGAVREFLELGDDRLVVCAIAFGYADPDHPSASFTASRAPIGDAVTFVD
jgi:nitroreductase